MMKRNGATLFSASDLVNFLGCAHATFLDLGNLEVPTLFPPDDDATVLLQQKGIEHERAYLQQFKPRGGPSSRSWATSTWTSESPGRVTRFAGPAVIYQGAFRDGVARLL